MTLLYIQAQATVPLSEIEEGDTRVQGLYSVEVPDDAPPGIAAGIALDRFHSTIAVGTLDDFAFTVVDKDGKEIVEADDYEAYSGRKRAGSVDYLGPLDPTEEPGAFPAP